MNVFEAVKEAVSTRQAAVFYGISVSRNGMALCPFHGDRHPSLKVDRRFHCFGCQADGDVIDFTARLFGLKPKEAAQKLAEDFAISYDRKSHAPPCEKTIQSKTSERRQACQEEAYCFQVLRDYRRLLENWKTTYAPKQKGEEWHPLFVEALQNQDYIDYLLEVLLTPDLEERAALVANYGKEVRNIEQRISEFCDCPRGDSLREMDH